MSNTLISFGPHTFLMHLDPQNISWASQLNMVEEDTFGGTVVQILSASLSTLSISGQCGSGGRGELLNIANMFKRLLEWQVETKDPAKFAYLPRGIKFAVYGLSITVSDKLENVAYPYKLSFEIEQDISGVATRETIAEELDRLDAGVGYTRNKFNDPSLSDPPATGGWSSS